MKRTLLTLVVLLLATAVYGQQQPVRMPATEEPAAGPPPASAELEQPASRPDLATFQQLAYYNHPGLRETYARWEAAKGRWVQVGLYSNPNVGYSGNQIGSKGLAEQQGIYIAQSLSLSGKLRLNREVAGWEIDKAMHDYHAMRDRISTDVALHFFEVSASQGNEQLLIEYDRTNREALQMNESLLRNMQTSKYEVLKGRLVATNNKLLQVQAQQRTENSWRRLTASAGVPNMPLQEVVSDWTQLPPVGSYDAIYEHLLTNSPEISRARAEVERTRWAYKRARREPVPDLEVAGIVQRDEAINNNDGALLATIPLPIFNRNQGNISSAWSEIVAAEQTLQRLKLDLNQRLADVYQRYRSADEQIREYEQNMIPLAEEQVRLGNQAFMAGEVTYRHVLEDRQALIQLRIQHLNAQYERAVSAWEIRGMLLRDSLKSQ